MGEMTRREVNRFLMKGLLSQQSSATVSKDGSSHVVPIWFVPRRQSWLG